MQAPRPSTLTRPRRKAAPGRRSAGKLTSDRVLDVAERLVQTRGYNGFSYADISEAMEVTKASLHYHFATKEELGRALIERYTSAFGRALEDIGAAGIGTSEQMERYMKLYGDVLEGGRMCLCGMLAAEYTSLPVSMQQGVRRFFDANEFWLASLLERGKRARDLHFTGSPAGAARALTAALEGAMLLARSYGDASRFRETTLRIAEGFKLAGQAARAPRASVRHKSKRETRKSR